ncbi:hypothetical protein I302_104390 [Kwoniella bestiolae CBS 10118]|uniref:RING-type domain-containing protein n=1 Tax=Kwoniella bestiolae CBS 10118 TaxID=1296100 RepID=A0A1B9GB46_9TREE|nr:hypothetical protein I302_03096 [Kwoniella bestiolae CBS 10118]OCF28244.1 hypothetical protein I302_03096 [Kwoniella bestiolae CBS 10118]
MNPPLQLKRPLPTSPFSSDPTPSRPAKYRKISTETQPEVFSPERYTLDVPWDPVPSRASLLLTQLGLRRSPKVRKSLQDLETPTPIRTGTPKPLMGSQEPDKAIHRPLRTDVNISRRSLIPDPTIGRSRPESDRGKTEELAIYVSSESDSYSESKREPEKKKESKKSTTIPPLPKFSSPRSSSPPPSSKFPLRNIAKARSNFGFTGSMYSLSSEVNRSRVDSMDDQTRHVCDLFRGDVGKASSATEITRRKEKSDVTEIGRVNVSSVQSRSAIHHRTSTSHIHQYIKPPTHSERSSKDICAAMIGLGKTGDSINSVSRMVDSTRKGSGIPESAESQEKMKNKKLAAPPLKTPAFSLEDVLATLTRWEEAEKQTEELGEVRCKTDQSTKTKEINKGQEKKDTDDYQKTYEENKLDKRRKTQPEEQAVHSPRNMSSEELKSRMQRLRDKLKISEEKSKMLRTNTDDTDKIKTRPLKENAVHKSDGMKKRSEKTKPDEEPRQPKSYKSYKSYRTQEDLLERKKEAIARLKRHVPLRYQGDALGNVGRFYQKIIQEVLQAGEKERKVESQIQAGPSNARTATSEKAKDENSECLICSEDIFDVLVKADEHGGSEYALWACELAGCGSVFCVTCAKAYVDRMRTTDCPACTRGWDVRELEKQYKGFMATKEAENRG